MPIECPLWTRFYLFSVLRIQTVKQKNVYVGLTQKFPNCENLLLFNIYLPLRELTFGGTLIKNDISVLGGTRDLK